MTLLIKIILHFQFVLIKYILNILIPNNIISTRYSPLRVFLIKKTIEFKSFIFEKINKVWSYYLNIIINYNFFQTFLNDLIIKLISFKVKSYKSNDNPK